MAINAVATTSRTGMTSVLRYILNVYEYFDRDQYRKKCTVRIFYFSCATPNL